MMMKKQSSPWALLKALYVLPVAFVAVAVISCTSPKEKKTEKQEVAQQEQPASIDESKVPSNAPQPKAEEQGEVFMVAEEQPMFPGGMQEMMKFLQTNIKYPKEAADKGIGGRVIVQFVVNTDGSICEEKVVKPVDPLLDAEALRVVRSMPNWTPGKQKGEPVRVRFTLPMAFAAQGGGNTSGTPHTATTVTTKGPVQVQISQEKSGDEIFNVVEELPMFPGGMEALMKHVNKEIKYPKEAQDKGTQGRVIVQFVVRKDGSITDAKVVKPVDPLLDAEALRVVNEMPNWIPGKQRGQAVNVRFTLPVTFRLQ